MPERPKGQIQNARLTGIDTVMRYPVGFADLEYRGVIDNVASGEQQTLRLLLRSDECRELAHQLTKLAAAIEFSGGQEN